MTKQQKKEMEIVAKFKAIIDSTFKECPLSKRVALFKELEKWGQTELGDEESYLFLTALYNADSTQETQITIVLNNYFKKQERNI